MKNKKILSLKIFDIQNNFNVIASNFLTKKL